MISKRTPRRSRKNPDLARMMLDIPPATATVLSKRLPMLAAGAVDPKKRRRREEQRMVSEKVAAGLEAGTAASRALITGSLAVVGAWWQAAGSLSSAPLPMGKRRGAGAWQKLAETTLDATLTTVEAAIRPAHRRVTANAHRLGKAKA